jgi:hypothetical protein
MKISHKSRFLISKYSAFCDIIVHVLIYPEVKNNSKSPNISCLFIVLISNLCFSLNFSLYKTFFDFNSNNSGSHKYVSLRF